MKYIVFVLTLTCATLAAAAEDNKTDTTPVLTPDELKTYPFADREKAKAPVIKELSVGQQFILSKDRRDVKSLIARHLGIMALRGDKSDLDTIQQIYDRKILKDNQVKEWQSVGVVFGDILANEYGLHWVSYEDEQGVSTALQWGNTQNFVFPVTALSKRLQFGEKIDTHALYDKFSQDIKAFIAYENKIKR